MLSVLPPSAAIAFIWCVLFACMAVARRELVRACAPRELRMTLLVVFGLCATYPAYTLGLRDDLIGEAANVALFVLSVRLIVRSAAVSRRAAVPLVPLALWLGFASVVGGCTLAAT